MMLTKMKNWIGEQVAPLKDYLKIVDSNHAEEPRNKSAFSLNEYSYPSFTTLLPYQYYDADSRLFLNLNNAGLLYRIIPLTGANEQIAEQLDTVLRTKVSHEFSLQVILVKHNQVGHQIDANSAQFSKAEFANLGVLGDNLLLYYQRAARRGFTTNSPIKPRITNTECYIVVDKINKETEEDLKAIFSRFRVSFEASLTAAKIGFKQGTADDFLYLLNFYLANDADRIYPRQVVYDQSRLLKHQALSHDFDLEVINDSLLISGVN